MDIQREQEEASDGQYTGQLEEIWMKPRNGKWDMWIGELGQQKKKVFLHQIFKQEHEL